VSASWQYAFSHLLCGLNLAPKLSIASVTMWFKGSTHIPLHFTFFSVVYNKEERPSLFRIHVPACSLSQCLVLVCNCSRLWIFSKQAVNIFIYLLACAFLHITLCHSAIYREMFCFSCLMVITACFSVDV
jgi:hypothetical protein